MSSESKDVCLAAIVGWPVSHSLSPVIHEYWAAKEKVTAHYIRVPAPPTQEAFNKIIDGLRKAGFRGVNITIPHKEHALAIADQKSAVALAIGAANMLTLHGEEIYADNSDALGFATAVRSAGDVNPSRPALVIGAGGGARAIVYALQSLLGVKDIFVINRTPARAEALAKALSAKAADWSDLERLSEQAGIIVNTTSLGMTGEPGLDFSVASLDPTALVADIVYTPLDTRLLKDARSRGLRTVSGLSMLMHQAVPGYKAWIGDNAVVDQALRTLLEEKLNTRQSK